MVLMADQFRSNMAEVLRWFRSKGLDENIEDKMPETRTGPGPKPECESCEFTRETLRLATERYQKAETLVLQYKKAILALIDSMGQP